MVGNPQHTNTRQQSWTGPGLGPGPGSGPTLQLQVLPVAAEVEVSDGRAQVLDQVLDHTPGLLAAEAAPRHVQLLDAARDRDGDRDGDGDTAVRRAVRRDAGPRRKRTDREHEASTRARAAAEKPEQPLRLSCSRSLFSDKDLGDRGQGTRDTDPSEPRRTPASEVRAAPRSRCRPDPSPQPRRTLRPQRDNLRDASSIVSPRAQTPT